MELSIVLPIYNKGECLEKRVREIINVVKNYGGIKDFEIIAVDDGSKDNTRSVLNKVASYTKVVKAIFNDRNMGKGYAIKRGLEAAKGKAVIYIDADMEIDPIIIPAMYKILMQEDYDMIVASKYKSCFLPKKGPIRKIMSLVFIFISHLLFPFLPVVDTQTGCKGMNRKAVELAKNVKYNDFLFDLELIIRARLSGLSIKEIPCIFREDESKSAVNFRRTLRMVANLIMLFADIYLGRYIRSHQKGSLR